MGNSNDKEKSSEPQSIKEIEDQKVARKKAQERKDDIALVVGLTVIMILTVSCVVVKILMDPKEDMNVSTFKPLKQQVNSNDKYTDLGYIPCNGYVPCKTDQMSPTMIEERMEGADPCHDYNEGGPGPDGCW